MRNLEEIWVDLFLADEDKENSAVIYNFDEPHKYGALVMTGGMSASIVIEVLNKKLVMHYVDELDESFTISSDNDYVDTSPIYDMYEFLIDKKKEIEIWRQQIK